MIRSKKENTTKTRKLDGKVPVDELENLMRAMGYYPTKQEIKNMTDEVRYSSFTEEAIPCQHVTLDKFISLFVNHRPVYGIGKNNIEDAFQALLASTGDANGETISRDDLVGLLKSEGESIQTQELEQLLLLLCADQRITGALKEDISADYFASEILGFEEVDENEIEEVDGAMGDSQTNMGATGQPGASYFANEPIPEEPLQP